MNHEHEEPTAREEEVGKQPSSKAELEAIRDAMRPPIRETEAGAPIMNDPRGTDKTTDSDWRMDPDGQALGLKRIREMRADVASLPGVPEARAQRAIDSIIIEDIPNRPRPEDLEDPFPS